MRTIENASQGQALCESSCWTSCIGSAVRAACWAQKSYAAASRLSQSIGDRQVCCSF